MPKPIYATLNKLYSIEAMRAMRFMRDGSRMVKRGACRRARAVATSVDGIWWRITPLERGWKN